VPTPCQPTGTSLPLPNSLRKSLSQASRPRGASRGAELAQQVPARGSGTLGTAALPSPEPRRGSSCPRALGRAEVRFPRAGWACLPGATFICTNSSRAGKVDVGLSLSPPAIGGECKHGWGGNAAAQGHPRRGSLRWAAALGDPLPPHPAWGWSWVSQPQESRGAAGDEPSRPGSAQTGR